LNRKSYWIILLVLMTACVPRVREQATVTSTAVTTTTTGLTFVPTVTNLSLPTSTTTQTSSPLGTPTLEPAGLNVVTVTPLAANKSLPQSPIATVTTELLWLPVLGLHEPLAGMIFEIDDAYWLINPSGQFVFLTDQAAPEFSTDCQCALFTSMADIWRTDFNSGAQTNLTNTPVRDERSPEWWPGDEETVIFYSLDPTVDETGGFSPGFLTILNLEAKSYQVIESLGFIDGDVAPQPNGSIFAYDGALYNLEGRALDLSLSTFVASGGFENCQAWKRIDDPVWSPTGSKLAWNLYGGEACRFSDHGVGIYDLDAMTAHFLHPFEHIPRGGSYNPVTWSPDAQWLVFFAAEWDEHIQDDNLWVMKIDGSEEYLLAEGGSYRTVAWDPHMEWLAFSTPSGSWLVKVGEWNGLYELEIPQAEIVAWVDLETTFSGGSVVDIDNGTP
jgi:hypothetical protein